MVVRESSLTLWRACRRRLITALLLFSVIGGLAESVWFKDSVQDQPLKPISMEGLHRYFHSHYENLVSDDALRTFLTSRQSIEAPTFTSGPNDSQVLVSLLNCEADAQISYTFVCDANYTIEDYELVASIGNTDIVEANDINIVYNQIASVEGLLAYNVTVDLDFHKWTGNSSFSLQALNRTTSEVTAISANAQLLVVGITFFQTSSSGEKSVLCGSESPLTLSAADLISNPNFNLDVFIQYYDGTTSEAGLSVPLSGITVSLSNQQTLINYDSSCSAISGTYDGSDVEFTSSCALGFSTNSVNGIYVGPMFGFDFNPYRNGTFTTSFEWNELVQGSDLELEGYSTSLQVALIGEVPPLVTSITPDGPFQVLGNDSAVVFVENVPTTIALASTWTFGLSIDFGSDVVKLATYNEGSYTVYQNGTASLIFTLPAGSGMELPWNFTATKPTLETLTAIDQTDPTYLFNFARKIIISGIAPSSGSEEGGTNVTLIGEFPVVEGEVVKIFFDGKEIDSQLITQTGANEITFITPSRESIGAGFQVTVTVVIGEDVSNGISFSYIPSVILDSLNPNSGPLEGGTEVTLAGQFIDFDPTAQDSGIYFGGVRIDPVLITSSNSSVIIFSTPPHSDLNNATVYTYEVSVQVSGAFSNVIPFSYELPLEIYSIVPDSGDESGGTSVILTGSFSGFSPSNSVLFFGGKQIDFNTISYNDTAIQFETPPRSEVGSAYTWQVWVTIGSVTSNAVYFTYEDGNSGVTIDGGGGSSGSSSGYYQLGACTDGIFRAVISSGARFQNARYEWSLTQVDGDANILSTYVPAITSNAAVLFLPYEAFPEQNIPYSLTLTVTTDFASFQQNLTVVQLSAQAIGVNIFDPQKRSFSNPNVTLTIPADLGIPGCRDNGFIINSTAITYEWVFRETKYVFSYENTTAPEAELSPTLLGREFHIPQALMAYGSFSISLTAYFSDDPSVRGGDSTTVVVEPAPLIAQINAGELSQYVSVGESFTLSASLSRDPDVLEGDTSQGLSFSWSCRYAWDTSMNDAITCGDQLLSSSQVSALEFTLLEDNLRTVYNTSSEVYIEYSLQVSKTSKNATDADIFRQSDVVTSTLVLVRETDVVYESLKEVLVENNQSSLLDKVNVKYYEDVIITPVTETNETTWTFELLSPHVESRTLLANDDNLINLPGYVSAGSEASRLSLGIKANVLSPNTDYVFLISTFRSSTEINFEVNKQVVSLSTVEQPTVKIGNLVTPEGNTTDTFILSAYTNYEADFKFFFILTDDLGFESCVGGCQGENVIRFTLATEGSYSVRCDVYDSLGYTLLSSDVGGNITVSNTFDEEGSLAIFSEYVESAFLAGDHSDFQQFGIDMVKHIWSYNGSLASTIDSEIIANFTEGMSQVAANAVPNAIQAAGYVRMAAALATLTPDTGITYSTESLYYLVNITVNALERTPDNTALQQIEELLDFYELTPELVLATYSDGTSRRRLLQDSQSGETEVLALWLDLYETMKDQIAVTVLKKCSCGCVEEVTVPLRSQQQGSSSRQIISQVGRNLSPAAAYVNPNQGLLGAAKITVAHFCNHEQGTNLFIDQGTEKQIQFSWCKGVYENTIKKLYFVLATTPDYLYLSRLHDNVTLSDGLYSTMVTEIKGNVLQNASHIIPRCYNLEVPVLRNLTESVKEVPDDQVPQGVLFAPRKEWGENDTAGLYRPIFNGIETVVQDVDVTTGTQYTSAKLSLSRTGVLAVATRIAWSGSSFSLEGVFLTAAEVAGVVMTIFVLVLMASMVAWLLATRLFAAKEVAAPVEADFTYVERDVYGRGTAIDMMEEQEALRRAQVVS